MKIYPNDKYHQALENFLSQNYEYNGMLFRDLDPYTKQQTLEDFTSNAAVDYENSKIQLLRAKYTIGTGDSVFKLLPDYFNLILEDENGNTVHINLRSVLDLSKLDVDCNESIHYTIIK